jgi:membrane protease subunit (stomatin/prohibitin family)
MALWDKLRGELIDIVEWLDDTNDTLVWRFPRYQNEIKYGAKLVVREGQAAVFVDQGRIADVFQPGLYTLTTQNLPILATLLGWKYGFESPFKAEVYFISTRQFTDLKWGTQNPIMMRDAEFGMVRIRAFGSYVIRAKDPGLLIRQLVGTDGRFTLDEIINQLRNLIVARFADIVGSSKIPVLDMAANYDDFGDFLRQQIGPEFEAMGLELTKLLVENISLPPAVEEVLDKRTSMGIVGNMQTFTQYNIANSIPDAAKNPGGLAAAGVGLGLGVGMAGQVGQAMSGQGAAAPGGGGGGPPPIPQAAKFYVAVNGQQTGPFEAAALRQQVEAGRLAPQTLVWRQGMPQWQAAGEVSELSALFAAPPGPPPIPKS